MTRLFATSMFCVLLALAALSPSVSFAEPPVMVSEEELSKIERMAGEARENYLKERREELEKLSEDARRKKLEERKAAFSGLSEEKQKELQERMHKLRLDIQRARFEKMALSPEEREAKEKAFLNTLSPEQRKLWNTLADERAKWEKAGIEDTQPAQENQGVDDKKE